MVVGAGPNGLAAAITLAREGCRVLLVERAGRVGGAVGSAELTLPGFVHDLGAAVLPMGVGSPFFRGLPLERHGLRWVQPDAPLAHPLDDGPAVMLERSVERTAAGLGPDGGRYRALVEPLLADRNPLLLTRDILRPLLRVPRNPLLVARFGLSALQPASLLAGRMRGRRARALIAGIAAHVNLPLEAPATVAGALVLDLLAHDVGWPVPEGGAQRFADAVAAHFVELGGEIALDTEVRTLADLPPSRVTLLDLTPRQVVAVAGDRLPADYRRTLERYRYGAAVFKMDFALDGPIPWRDPDCARAGTVHLGNSFGEIAASERAVAVGRPPERPYVLLAQPSLFDPGRAPEGGHTCWAYCHVPHGSPVDMSERIEAQIERFAPGFRDRVLARSCAAPARLERFDPNLVGGDINGGPMDLRGLLVRPVARPVPYATPLRGLYLCSASTPPGGGVHGMAGFHAARAALRRDLGVRRARGWSEGPD